MAQAPADAEFDLSSATDCRVILQGLFQAQIMAASGNTRTRVRVHDRWTDYSKANVIELQTLYRTIYGQCRAAGTDMTGLPDLNPGLRALRGPAVRGIRGPFPHL
jgi:hypothetical protein